MGQAFHRWQSLPLYLDSVVIDHKNFNKEEIISVNNSYNRFVQHNKCQLYYFQLCLPVNRTLTFFLFFPTCLKINKYGYKFQMSVNFGGYSTFCLN